MGAREERIHPHNRHGQLRRRYQVIRSATVELVQDLSAEDCALQSMPDASPVKWHLAHTSWFFETFVLEGGLRGYRCFDPHYRTLFNSYYVQVGPRHTRAERGLLSRPGLREVLAYRAHVDEAIARWMDGQPSAQALDLFELGLHHEQQHQELILTDLKHLFSRNPLRPAYRAAPARMKRDAPALEWSRHAGGLCEIGHAGEDVCFDNEQPRHAVFIAPFRCASRPVTNGEYLAFMRDGGYQRPELWLSDGWDARCHNAWEAPLYWEHGEDGWRRFTLHGMDEVDPSAPVCHISYYEADAFARWADARLPTEAEWEIIARAVPVAGNLAESRLFDPIAAASSAGVPLQCFGDIWEWTASAYLPYPGYRPAAGAVGEYNGKFMVNQFVLRGGSCATPASHLRATYRNFFPPQARWQFSGMRLARDD
ncbi:MAG: ergothioneine biosynthesis protein EgtB [Burkholderiales bacterium]|nr:ergothioneine biosynthesis protein EgtB [Burkholderiales bacterium]